MRIKFSKDYIKDNKYAQFTVFLFILLFIPVSGYAQQSLPYAIADTDQQTFYDTLNVINEPAVGEAFFGQDAQYTNFKTDYADNGNGTISDLVTGLMWSKSPDLDDDGDIDVDDKLSYEEAVAYAGTFNLAGYDDWRLPTIKELYSLIIFSGLDPSGYTGSSTQGLVPFIDTSYFDFGYGDLAAGERLIDAQMATSTIYTGTTMMGDETMFGVNFADGRIKGYPTGPPPGQTAPKQFYVYFVRGNTEYGINNFQDNGDGTITDQATGLMWMQDDSGLGMTWPEALLYAENSELANYNDWRLPDAKELQSIVDYTRSLSASNSAAIDPIFNTTTITDEGGNENFPFYWTGTTHASMLDDAPGGYATYVCFGEALGWMEEPPASGNYTLMDVHGAGAQRSDPKVGDPANWPYGHGPQGDVIRIHNYVRLVRNADSTLSYSEPGHEPVVIRIYPNPAREYISVDAGNVKEGSAIIYNPGGEIVYSVRFSDRSTFRVNLEKFNPGIYFLHLFDGKMSVCKAFVVN